MEKNKVFCIGFHKTGTTSLGKLMEQLGYRNCHGAGPVRKELGDHKMMELLFKKQYDSIFKIAEQFDSFNDNPWFSLYQEMDLQFPNSKFICVYRDEESWINSCKKYFKDSSSAFRMFLYGYGSPIGNEERYLSVYRNHYKEVKAYFNDRENDVLYLNIKAPDFVEQVKSFLEIESKVTEFPHLNSTK